MLHKGYRVYGTFRRVSTPNFWRLQSLDIFSKIHLIPADLLDMGSLMEAIRVSKPDEVYNIAAASFVSTAFEQPVGNAEITGIAVTKLLEAIRFFDPKIKFYQASSSEMYGNSNTKSQNEKTPFDPASPYAAAKLYAHSITNNYKEAYNMFAVSGILFNHESPLRGIEFVTRKITNGVAKIYLGLERKLTLGNINTQRDWGFAPDYVEAMYLMLQQKNPETYVIGTGDSHSVKEFVELAFNFLGLNWKKYVRTDKRFYRPLDVKFLCADSKKARKKLGWRHKIKFEKLVKKMLDEDVKRWQMFLEGKSFPWDAPLYPSESKLITRSRSNVSRKSYKIKRKNSKSNLFPEF